MKSQICESERGRCGCASHRLLTDGTENLSWLAGEIALWALPATVCLTLKKLGEGPRLSATRGAASCNFLPLYGTYGLYDVRLYRMQAVLALGI
jgi:hypothetical protein